MAWIEKDINNCIQEIHCETADDMLDYLRPSHSRWLADTLEIAWIFRGHQREDWKLEPSVLRASVPFFELTELKLHHSTELFHINHDFIMHAPQPISSRFNHILTLAACEKIAVNEFLEAVDDVGLPIPDDLISPVFRLSNHEFLSRLLFQELSHQEKWNSESDPNKEITGSNYYKNFGLIPWYLESDVVALAQHHGIPTRLIDWTTNPWIAAFFAASGERVGETENIAVWALCRAAITYTELQTFQPSRSRIGYLHSQSGLFVYDKIINRYYVEHGIWRTIETIVADLGEFSPFPKGEKIRYWLRKITLPSEFSKELIVRLKAHNIARRFLMPTYDNVTAELRVSRNREMEGWNHLRSNR